LLLVTHDLIKEPEDKQKLEEIIKKL